MSNTRLGPEVNRILFARNLPYKITGEELYELFGRFGAIRQVRLGTSKSTRGTAFVVFEDIFDAKKAMEGLTGFKVGDRYLNVLYFKPSRVQERIEAAKDLEEVEELRRKHRLAV